jgi:hypothetical protein
MMHSGWGGCLIASRGFGTAGYALNSYFPAFTLDDLFALDEHLYRDKFYHADGPWRKMMGISVNRSWRGMLKRRMWRCLAIMRLWQKRFVNVIMIWAWR